jgi:hypothetical protein
MIETRIYGEFCSFSSVGLVLIMENPLLIAPLPLLVSKQELTQSV